jgi:hypothetical protein
MRQGSTFLHPALTLDDWRTLETERLHRAIVTAMKVYVAATQTAT